MRPCQPTQSLLLLFSFLLGCGATSGPDTAPPSVSISSASTVLLHGVVALTATATDNAGVAGIQFEVDGTPLGVEDTLAPFGVDWETHQSANGTHQLSAVARDRAGNTAESTALVVTVSNALPLADKIVFASDGRGPNGNSDIFVMKGDGTGLQRLTSTDDLYEGDPAVSPDGRRIAFTRRLADGNLEIFLMNADGSGEVNLTQDPAVDFYPTWSPDGARIAFTSERAGGRQIFIMNGDGTNVVQVTHLADLAEAPEWSPDGGLIAFSRRTAQDQSAVAIVAPDGTGLRNLTPLGLDDRPAWSPDGTRIAFTRFGLSSHIVLINVDGSNIQNILTGSFDSYPVWSRSGNQLVFERNVDDGNDRDIWVMNLDGGGAFRLTSIPGSDISPDVSP